MKRKTVVSEYVLKIRGGEKEWTWSGQGFIPDYHPPVLYFDELYTSEERYQELCQDAQNKYNEKRKGYIGDFFVEQYWDLVDTSTTQSED